MKLSDYWEASPPIVWTVTPSLYDNGAVHVLTTPAGPYTYAYDGLGRLHKIIVPDLRETTWDYDPTTGRLSDNEMRS